MELVAMVREWLSYLPWVVHLLYYRVADPCREAGASRLVSYDDALACYESFPLLYSTEQAMLATLRWARAMDGRGQDVEGLIQSTRHSTEHRLQRDVMQAYNRRHDAAYTSQCFTAFEFVHPFPLEMVGDELHVVRDFAHHPSLVERWEAMGLSFRQYGGARVAAIDHRPALDYLATFAEQHVGMPDPQARLAMALARVRVDGDGWVADCGVFARTRLAPERPTLALTLHHHNASVGLEVPYLAISPTNFHSRASFYQRNCLTQQTHVSEYLPAPQPRSERAIRVGKATAYLREGGGVLRVGDFAGEPAAQAQDVLSALAALKRQGVARLVLDLSDLAGDCVCLVQLLLKALFDLDMAFHSNLRHSAVLDQLIELSAPLLGLAAYTRPSGNTLTPSYLKTQYHFRNSPHSFTPPMLDACPQLAAVPDLAPARIALLSNGICFGACRLLAAAAAVTPHVYLVGGSSRYPATVASSPDFGSVEVSEVIAALGAYANLTQGMAPNPFPSVARLAVAWRQFIDGKGGYSARPPMATHRLHLSPMDPFAIWDHALDLMGRPSPS